VLTPTLSTLHNRARLSTTSALIGGRMSTSGALIAGRLSTTIALIAGRMSTSGAPVAGRCLRFPLGHICFQLSNTDITSCHQLV
jgi:hypothetical protein